MHALEILQEATRGMPEQKLTPMTLTDLAETI